MPQPPLFSTAFLRGRYANEYAEFRDSVAEQQLFTKLERWAARQQQKESSAQGTFVGVFFRDTWGYVPDGIADGVTLREQFAVRGAGAGGGTGQADLALGWFDRHDVGPTPQVLCEFKDIRASLDAPQRRKGNDRSPVQQCADYLKEGSRGLRYGAIEPTWGIVSDMNEFRLYWRDTMPAQAQRFVIARRSGALEPLVLLDDSEAARFQRFLFWKLFQPDMLLTAAGPSSLLGLLREQGVHERDIETMFYSEYSAYRQAVFDAIDARNPKFEGTRGKLVRLTQRFLDRCIFILFCEDIGPALSFPQNLLRELLIERSNSKFYDPEATDIWIEVNRLFQAMREGTPFGPHRINRFNGGLFADEPELAALILPNKLFCAWGQGAAPERWGSDPNTLLFFSSQYNFGVQPTGERSIGLHTLGRIFEQSITDLELLEARAEGRPSLTELSKRKRDGVYYTPEWVTYFVVEHTLGPLLATLRAKCGLTGGRDFSEEEARIYRDTFGRADAARFAQPVRAYLTCLDRYEEELMNLKILDPACGSGAFLIQSLRMLVRERESVADERDSIRRTRQLVDPPALIRDVLSKNIYGVDTNAESVEIARLALWLETAVSDRPLATLDATIRCGNSLVDSQFYNTQQIALFSESRREHINTFDWKNAFPDVFEREPARCGFDGIVGNPPYVKLQNFRQVDPEVSDYLVQARGGDGAPLYASTQVGNIDLYLPFIEKGLALLNEDGHMGYIAPSVWLINEYGAGLRGLIHDSRRLDRWIDFKHFQVFDEAMTYTALQFYSGRPVEAIRCIFAPDGSVSGIDWDHPDAVIPYSELPRDTEWRLLPKEELHLLRRLDRDHKRLDQASKAIVVGLQTSADHIYHLEKVAPGQYRSFAAGKDGRVVAIEDAIMRPLVSGTEAKRYLTPITTTHLLFPYDDSPGQTVRLLGANEVKRRFPLAWKYLVMHEGTLRAREKRAFDDDAWYRFGRNQNLDKQRLPKIGVAQTVPSMRAFFDSAGAYCLNNVRVNGILVLPARSSPRVCRSWIHAQGGLRSRE